MSKADANRRPPLTIPLAALALALAAPLGADEPTGDPVIWPDAETWAFEVPAEADPARYAGGALDLRHLNEEVAGEHGFIRLSQDGDDFVRGDGQVIRFWGVHSPVQGDLTDAEAKTAARWLARLGVNLARTGSGINPKQPDAELGDVDEQALHRHWRNVAAMKREGIYSNISPYWAYPSFVRHIPESWGIAGVAGRNPPVQGLLFFHPVMQKAYKAWVKRLFTETNPYTGIPLKDDPALAIIQIQNEDTLLFYTMQRIEGPPRRLLEKQFGDWAAQKYGSLAAALDAWDATRLEEDDLEAGRLGVMLIWYLTADGWPQVPNQQRGRDTLQFLVSLQRNFYEEMARYLHEDLGCRQLIAPSNFHSADVVLLDDLERYTMTAVDVIDSNDYFGPHVHKGEASSWRTDPGHYYKPRSATLDPDLPAAKKQVVGHPFCLTETMWVNPNRYESEGPLMMACYMAMNGIDAVGWAGPRHWTYDPEPYLEFLRGPNGAPMRKFNCAQPGTMAAFPAAALIRRLGLVEPGPTVVHEERTLEQMLDRKPPVIAESFSFDPNRYSAEYETYERPTVGVDPRAFLVGRVEVKYGGDPNKTRVHEDLPRFIDHQRGAVRSANGQLAIDPTVGLFTVNAPKAQGAAGFLGRLDDPIELTDVTIDSANDYATIVVVSLDGEPIADSRRLLVQVGTVARPTGWTTRPATFQRNDQQFEGLQIVNTGAMPWRLRNAAGRVTVANPNLTRATRLDELGFADRELDLTHDDGTVNVDLPPDALYIILEPETDQRPGTP